MKVSEAKEIAQQWVDRRITQLPNITHAFYYGSASTRDDDAELPSTSDIDVRLVVDQDVPDMFTTLTGEFSQKFHLVQGVILDVSYMSLDSLDSLTATIPGDLQAVNFHLPNAIYDPDGKLQNLYLKARTHFRDEEYVRQRCQEAQEAAYSWFIQAANSTLNEHGWPSKRNEAISWLYLGASPTVSQIPCVAALSGITLLTCLVKARNTLYCYGYDDVYHDILQILGLDNLTQSQVEAALRELSDALHYARTVYKTPFYGDHHLQEILEPLVIHGSWELIHAGFHKEAMLWVLGMRTWIQNAIENDGAEPEKTHFRLAYEHMLST